MTDWESPHRNRTEEAIRKISEVGEVETSSTTQSEDKDSHPYAQTKGFSFLRRRNRSSWTENSRKTDEDGIKGPLGLHLLHASPQPLINLIFVHGLRGGSIKTWRKGDDSQMFWPQYWLPREADLSNASVYSFGYDSDWGSTKPSILSVHDFGWALFEEMRSFPSLRKEPSTPIILIAHSMGGLVIKKAYILAQQDVIHPQLAKRIRCMFFLATPHRGSDYASVLNTVLAVSGIFGISSSREYINDITKGSTSAQLINEEFGRHAKDLQIYSFYETLPTRLGLSSSMIVDRDSAVLGDEFKNETARYINANHREICKFDGPEDPKYLSLKNSLASVVQDLLRDVFESHEVNFKSQLQTVQAFLGVSSLPSESHEKVEGSCQWLNERDDYREWRDAPDELDASKDTKFKTSLYWINANPGAGKTVLASYVVSQLDELRLQHAFYYFHAGKTTSQSLSYFLRSMAYQMAASNADVRSSLVKLCNDGSTFDKDDTRAIWSKVFRAGIFKVPLSSPQYWVLDAIDECVKYPEFFTLLKGTQSRFPLRILITSRKTTDIQKTAHLLQGCVISIVEIPVSETLRDIELFVRNRTEFMPIDSAEEKQYLIAEILSKSKTSFLWVRLVLDELDGVYGYESTLSVIRGIPEGMIPYYQQILAEMAENKREKHIAKAILLWVVGATRPLSISELSEAIKVDIKVHLPGAKTAIEGLCGQLVSVDKETSLVNIVHLTAREFLFSDDAGEFKISRSEAHDRIALTCLELLVSPIMQPPKHRNLLDQKRPEQPSSLLLEYSITQFSEHVFGASSGSDKLLVALDRFLTTTVLSWVRRIVSKGYLHHLFRVARNFKAYLDRRAKYQASLNRHINKIASWATDLSRLATKFGAALTSQPQSIYFLIPPLCPRDTAIYLQFGKSSDGLMVGGFKNSDWDDCVATINFEAETAATVTCDNNRIAVGFESGNIQLYHHSSFRKENIIEHGAAIDLLLLDPLGSFIASSSTKYLTLWDLKGNFVWQKRIRSRCIALTCSSTFIMGVAMSGRAYQWDISTGEQLEEYRYPFQPLDPNSQLQSDLAKAPFKGSFDPSLELLALAYRNGPTCIYELQSHSWIAWAALGGNYSRQAVVDLVFNPNPELTLLLIAYDDSHLALYESWSGALVRSHESETRAILTSLTCSSDGRTFGTVDVLGNLQIWDFESLTLLYHILTPNHSFRILGFTSDGANLVDIVDHEMKIWSPSALVRKTVGEESSTSDQAAILPVSKGQFATFQSSEIRSTVAHPVLPAIFVSNYHGDVLVYDTASTEDTKSAVLYSHQSTVVKCLAVTHSDKIASADSNGNVQVWRLDTSQHTKIKVGSMKFQARFPCAICQIIFDQTGKYLLVSTMDSDHVYDCEAGILVGSIQFQANGRSLWKWVTLPDTKDTQIQQFTLISDHEFVSYSAEAFPERIGSSHLKLDWKVEDGFVEKEISTVVMHPESMLLVLEVRQQHGYETSSSVFIFKLPEPSSGSETAIMCLKPTRTLASDFCMHILGISRADNSLVFLHRNSWVSSINLSSSEQRKHTQHFFVPSEFVTNSSNVLPIQTVDDNFVFCLYDKLAIMKNGLKFKEVKALG
ncbi:NACHT and WD domain protein [Halenospora varia]|nr:NACHT and WD domain protein [Halenospora varia]